MISQALVAVGLAMLGGCLILGFAAKSASDRHRRILDALCKQYEKERSRALFAHERGIPDEQNEHLKNMATIMNRIQDLNNQ